MKPLFTIGFAGKTAEQFFSILKYAGVERVLDVRLHNTSQLAGYTKRSDLPYFLKSIVGAGYTHLSAFAPSRELLDDYKKQRIDWAGYEQIYNDLLATRNPMAQLDPAWLPGGCMLCAEPTPECCHRRLAAEYACAAQPSLQIHHL